MGEGVRLRAKVKSEKNLCTLTTTLQSAVDERDTDVDCVSHVNRCVPSKMMSVAVHQTELSERGHSFPLETCR